jgi:hypothetical protein
VILGVYSNFFFYSDGDPDRTSEDVTPSEAFVPALIIGPDFDPI